MTWFAMCGISTTEPSREKSTESKQHMVNHKDQNGMYLHHVGTGKFFKFNAEVDNKQQIYLILLHVLTLKLD